MKEKFILSKIRKLIENEYKGIVVKYSGFCYAEAGVADLLCGIPNKEGKLLFVGIEVKKKDGHTTKLQENWLNKVRLMGGIALCVRSTQDVIDGLMWNNIILWENSNMVSKKGLKSNKNFIVFGKELKKDV